MPLLSLVSLLVHSALFGQLPTDAGVDALVPPTLLQEVRASYPLSMEGTGADGQVTLNLTIADTGLVEHAHVVSATNDAFAHQALQAAVQLRFTPAQVSGVARAVEIQFQYRFVAPPPQAVEAIEKKAVLRGLVRSMGSRAPIATAQVLAEDGTLTETDGDGRFTLTLSPKAQWIYISASGFEKAVNKENLSKVENLEVEYALRPTRVNPFETVVKTDRERTELRRIELRDAEIREVPGTFGDPFRVVMVLPGVSAVASGVGYPVVRGSSPASTGYYLDGVRIPQLYHVFLGPAVVHPDFLGGLDFYPGGAPVQYGRILGGVINGKLTEHVDGKFRATGYGDLINAGLFVEAPFEKTGTRVSAGGRISYTGLLIGAVATAVSPPNSPSVVADFWDYQLRVQQKLLGGTAQLLAFGSGDVFGTKPDSDSRGATSLSSIIFHRVDARYRHTLGVGEAFGEFTFGRDGFGFENLQTGSLGPNGQPVSGEERQTTTIGQNSFISKGGWQADLTSSWHMQLGLTWDHIRASFDQSFSQKGYNTPPVEITSRQPLAIGNFTAAYGDLTYSPNNTFSVTLGVRGDAFALAPRLIRYTGDIRSSAQYTVNDALSFRASAGLFHQPPTLLFSLPVVDVASVQFGIQEVIQNAIGATYTFRNGLELSADAYINPMTQVIEIPLADDEAPRNFQPDTGGTPGGPGGGGSNAPSLPTPAAKPGLSYGLDMMLRMPMKGRWFGWLTLSLQRSQRRETFLLSPSDRENSGTGTADLPYAFDQTVVSNAVLSYRFDNGWSLGGTLHFNTGRPENGTLSPRTQRLDSANRWQPVPKNQVDRLPPFFRGDIRVSKTFVYRDFTLEGYLDMLNVTISQEVLGYNYGYQFSRSAPDPNFGPPQKTPIAVPIVVPNLGLKIRY